MTERPDELRPQRETGRESGREAGGTVVQFRRRQTPPKRKRASLWSLVARPLALALAILVLPAAALAWVSTSPRFALAEIEVEGADRVDAAWVRQTLAPLLGRNLPRLSLAIPASRLAAHPWIASAEIEKRLPSRLAVRIVERQPMALLARGGRLYWSDVSGRAIAPIGPGEVRPRLLTVRFGEPVADGVARALDIAQELGRANPDWAAELVEIEVLSAEDFRIVTAALPFPLLVRSGDVVEKVDRLERLLPRLSERYAALAAVDLRIARRIVVQPDSRATAAARGV